MSSPDLTHAEIQTVERVLRTPHLSLGPCLTEFEERTAAYVGVQHGVAVSSGTAGLHLCIIAAGIGDGDLVITTPFSFVASANCILYERAMPIFVDVEPATGNLDPNLVAEAVESLIYHPSGRNGKRIRWLPPSLRSSRRSPGMQKPPTVGGRLKAILPVHAFGQPADVDPLTRLAQDHNLAVIEDACEAIGAEYKGRKVGTLGDAAVFAFYPNKQITTGEGGLIVTHNTEWADLFRSLRNQGRDIFDAWLNHTRLGYNYRMDEMSAALGLAQITRVGDLLAKRAAVAGWYNERLAGTELIERPYIAPTTTRVSWFVYVIRVRPPANRNEVMQKLAELGIPSRPYFTPIHLQPYYRQRFGYQQGDFPVTEHLGDVSLALPFSGVMTQSQVDQVCAALEQVLPA
jgi:perosamine synthetase